MNIMIHIFIPIHSYHGEPMSASRREPAKPQYESPGRLGPNWFDVRCTLTLFIASLLSLFNLYFLEALITVWVCNWNKFNTFTFSFVLSFLLNTIWKIIRYSFLCSCSFQGKTMVTLCYFIEGNPWNVLWSLSDRKETYRYLASF